MRHHHLCRNKDEGQARVNHAFRLTLSEFWKPRTDAFGNSHGTKDERKADFHGELIGDLQIMWTGFLYSPHLNTRSGEANKPSEFHGFQR